MGERREARTRMVLPVRVNGSDVQGPFSLLVHTLDFSRKGARLGGVRRQFTVGDTVIVEYKHRRASFAVRWVGEPNSPAREQIGLQTLQPEVYLWIEVPETDYKDEIPLFRRRPKPPPRPADVAEISAAARDAAQLVTANDAMGDTAVATLETDDESAESEGADDQDTVPHPPAAVLEKIARDLQEELRAAGVAIAVPENGSMVCRAVAGRGPKIGVRFRAENGMAGEAIRTNHTVTSADTLSDPRGDSELWSKIQIRSAICVPVRVAQGTALLDIYGSAPNAFPSDCKASLENAASRVREVFKHTV